MDASGAWWQKFDIKRLSRERLISNGSPTWKEKWSCCSDRWWPSLQVFQSPGVPTSRCSDRWRPSRCSKVQVFQDDQAGLRLAGYRGWQASCCQLSSAVVELAQTGWSSTWKGQQLGRKQLWLDRWLELGGCRCQMGRCSDAARAGSRSRKYLVNATNRVIHPPSLLLIIGEHSAEHPLMQWKALQCNRDGVFAIWCNETLRLSRKRSKQSKLMQCNAKRLIAMKYNRSVIRLEI